AGPRIEDPGRERDRLRRAVRVVRRWRAARRARGGGDEPRVLAGGRPRRGGLQLGDAPARARPERRARRAAPARDRLLLLDLDRELAVDPAAFRARPAA